MGTVFGLSSGGVRKRHKRGEASLQVQVMQALDISLPKTAIAFHCPNGGSRNVIEATNLKRQGVKAGIPDIIIIYQGRAHGLELKSKNGRLQDSQRAMFPILRDAGMRIEVARTLNEALLMVKQMGIPVSATTFSYSGAA